MNRYGRTGRYEAIEAHPALGTVTWTMSPESARDVARFIRENCPAGDAAGRDADLLEAAADEVEASA